MVQARAPSLVSFWDFTAHKMYICTQMVILKATLDRCRKKEIGQDQQEARQQEDSETQSSVDQP